MCDSLILQKQPPNGIVGLGVGLWGHGRRRTLSGHHISPPTIELGNYPRARGLPHYQILLGIVPPFLFLSLDLFPSSYKHYPYSWFVYHHKFTTSPSVNISYMWLSSPFIIIMYLCFFWFLGLTHFRGRALLQI